MSLDEDTEFTIKTTHNPPVCVSLNEEVLEKLDIPIFSACKRFKEENCYTFDAGETSPQPWEAIFDGFKQGRIKVDNNYFMDSVRIFHYMFVGDLKRYHKEVQPMIMFSKFSHYTMDGLEQLLEYVSLYCPKEEKLPEEEKVPKKVIVRNTRHLEEVESDSEEEEEKVPKKVIVRNTRHLEEPEEVESDSPETNPNALSDEESYFEDDEPPREEPLPKRQPPPKKTVHNPTFPYTIPSNPEEVKEYIGVVKNLVERGLEVPNNKILWDFIEYTTKTLDKISEIDPSVDVLSYLPKKPYDLDEVMKPQMLYWMELKKLLDFSVWAGGSLQMALFNTPLPKESDIDLWVFSEENLFKVLQGIYMLYEGQVFFVHERSVITVYIDENYKRYEPKHPIQIIYMGEENSPYKAVRDFDFDYIKCYTNGNDITFLPECLRSHKTKTVYKCQPIVQSHRADKVRSRGFQFESDPKETNTERSHFFPDTSIFSKEFTKTILSKFHPSCKVLEKPEEIKEVPVFKKGMKEKDYTLTVISLEEPGNKFDSIELGEWYDHRFSCFKTCHFRTEIELQLENVFLPFGIDTDPGTQRVNGRMLLEGVPEHVSSLVERLEKSLSKHFKEPSDLRSRVSFNQFKTKIQSNTKVIDGITGDPISGDPLELDLKQNMVSAVIRIRGLWKSKYIGYGLLSQIVKLTVYPKNFNYHKRSIIGVIG